MVIMAYVIFWMLFNLPEKLDEMGYKKISDELYKLLNDDNVDLSKKREKYTRIGRLDQGSILQ